MCLFNVFILSETRTDVLLARESADLRQKATPGESMYICCEEDFEQIHHQASSLIITRLMRSISLPTRMSSTFQSVSDNGTVMLATEPIVTALSLWAGVCWGCIYLGGTTDLSAFAAYGFGLPTQGTLQV